MPIDKESFTLDNLRPIFSMVIVMWVVQFGNWFLDYELNQWFGIAPRQLEGLMGVPLSPFLHANWSHILANTVPLLMLGGMAAMVAPTRFFDATLIIILLGGLMVWLMARGGLRVHVGASGLIFGYLGFVVALGVIERSLRTIVFAASAAVLYGGTMIWGVLPIDARVSWESHLFGAVAGIAAAYTLRRNARPKRNTR